MSSVLSTFMTRVRESFVSAVVKSGFELFLISVLILFLELACIRWFPAHVIFLTFFTNVVLLACFIGMSVGCLAAGHKRNYILWTPFLLAGTLLLALLLELFMSPVFGGGDYVDVGGQANPDVVYFGTEVDTSKLEKFTLPIEIIGGTFFLLIALVFVGPGQELGRALTRVPHRVWAYTINISGSLVGIVLLALMSWLELTPLVWFFLAGGGLLYFILPRGVEGPSLRRSLLAASPLLLVLALVGIHTGTYVFYGHHVEFLWSPYYRIDYNPGHRFISVNQIGHQAMRDIDYPTPEYALPHLLNRDIQEVVGGTERGKTKPIENILIIGAGSGNDVARALLWGDENTRIDAVEIDPVIFRIGEADNPIVTSRDKDGRPIRTYQDPRVTVRLNDGRNFLRNAEPEKYDLIIYALVDSLVLHSGYSNIRLESYLFTEQAFKDIQRALKPDGLFVTYNYFRQGWIVARVANTLNKVFGENNAVVFTYPHMDEVKPEFLGGGTFGVVFAGPGTERLKKAFDPDGTSPLEYWIRPSAPTQQTPNGFKVFAEQAEKYKSDPAKFEQEKRNWWRFAPAKVVQPTEPLKNSTDDWPFLYVRNPTLPPSPTGTGMIVMAFIAVVLILLFLPRGQSAANGTAKKGWGFDLRMFFLGAGFMLIETKAVVHMALLFGSTWTVNSVVFFAVLVMILLANLFVLRVKPENLWPYYIGLFVSLALNAVIPLDFFLSMGRVVQIILSCLLVFTPIAFAGVIFATAFRKTAEPDRAFGANIAGAMLGGLAENLSMLTGFQWLVLIGLGFYALSGLAGAAGWINPTREEGVPPPTTTT